MAIRIRNKVKSEFSTTSMPDLVFLLLIFFMLTSTLVSPNAIKLLLPQSDSKTMAKQTITVYINDRYDYFIGENKIAQNQLENNLADKLALQNEGVVVLRSDKSVPIQYVVNVIDAVNNINDKNNSKHKVILATKPKK
ncbi:MAG: biopolymer transporter ExbD [Bacteroidales bacterium]|nr:biopolymer transporter ExbD [Bacteroidales bacterium]MCF8332837.1 biopolymer transporter ExbD [Bacteroidales bacterium]